MKIAVNTRFLLKNKLEGIGWFTYETLKRITKSHPGHEFVFFFDRPYDKEFVFSENVTPVVLFPPARHPLLWYWWFEQSLPGAIKKSGADLFLSTDNHLSLAAEVPSVLVMHDIAYEHYPSHVPWLTRKFYKFYFPKYLKKAARVATVSEFSKKDIISHYGIDDKKIDVVYNGAGKKYHPLNTAEKEQAKQKYAGGADYFLYIGSLHPRKNILGLLQAFEQFKENDDRGIKLLLAGRKAWGNAEMENFYEQMKFKNEVIFLGHCQQDDLAKILGASLALTYVSFFEGFGIPIVEAMHAEVPVITSNISSMPEIAGEAALLTNPLSAENIAEAMKKAAYDEPLRGRLISAGRMQREKFSWDRSAELLWECMERVM